MMSHHAVSPQAKPFRLRFAGASGFLGPPPIPVSFGEAKDRWGLVSPPIPANHSLSLAYLRLHAQVVRYLQSTLIHSPGLCCIGS